MTRTMHTPCTLPSSLALKVKALIAACVEERPDTPLWDMDPPSEHVLRGASCGNTPPKNAKIALKSQKSSTNDIKM